MILNEYKKLDSASISDALDSLNIRNRIPNLLPRSSNKKMVGYAYTVQYSPYKVPLNSFKNAGNYIDNVKENEIILLDNNGLDYCTVWGGILTKMAEIKKISGVVIYGAIRDIEEVEKSNVPIFSTHTFMCSAKNRFQLVSIKTTLKINDVTINPDDLIFGDKNGVLVVPKDLINICLTRAINIKKTEEKIIKEITSGMTLEKAREKHNYAKPWENTDGI